MRNSILIVDDIQANLILLDKILSDEGYDVISAINGDDAVKFAKENDFDLILLDIMMPKKDGFMVFEELKSNERTSKIPVIFITVINNDADTLKAFEMGAVDYITKPYTPTELRIRVRTQIALVNAHGYLNSHEYSTSGTKRDETKNLLITINERLKLINSQIQSLNNVELKSQEKANLGELNSLVTKIAKQLQDLSQ